MIKFLEVAWLFLGSCLMVVMAANNVASTVAATNDYTVTENAITCVAMTTGIKLQIPYVGQSRNETATFYVPVNTTVSGNCLQTRGQNNLTIGFYDDWMVTIVFSNSSQSGEFFWKEVDLTYVIDQEHFPDASNQPVKVTVQTTLPNDTFRAKVGKTYTCANPTLTLNNSIVLLMSSFQYTAFGTSNATTLSSTDVVRCQKDFQLPPENVALVMGVGIGLGALIFLVVFLYIVSSKLRQK